MSAELVVLAPVLARPANAARLARNITSVSQVPTRLLFICSPNDTREIRACQQTGADVTIVPWKAGAGDWAKKLEHGRAMTTEPLMLLAADDLRFHPEWDVRALHRFAQADIGVLGTQDGGNPLVKRGQHSTHPIVCRGYVEEHGTIDEDNRMLHLGYDHAYCDNELCETAMARGCWNFARDVFIEHLHPSWKKAGWDSTYEKGSRSLPSDYQLFLKRRPLWARRSRRSR